jgi:hypothetical protein
LFQSLEQHNNAQIRGWAESRYLALREEIRRESELEKSSHRERNESFE